MRRVVVTVLKADISGSTPLAERLDPEELRGVLGAYFSALAREIQRHGGRVDKYIGDAVMAVFGLPDARPDDAARATRAALAMQEAIAVENDRLDARYGVRLSLRIGVHTGELTAPEGAELTLIGDVVTIAESMEAAAPLNTVLVSAATREATARRFRFNSAPPVKLKGRTDTVAAFRPVAARKRAADVAAAGDGDGGSASLQIGGQKQHVLQEERKVVTVLFADVVVSEGHLETERQRAVLGGYFSDMARVIERFGGTIDKFIGDAVMAVFGAPVSHDDDGVRAIAAGLAIQAAIRRGNDQLQREHGIRLAARVGINTGEVVAGLLAGEVRAYTVTGDAVNTAQRIESVAPLGEVLVSESTRALARGAFEYEAVLPLTLKGKSQPVPAYRVIGLESATPVEGSRLVGRETELAWLQERFALAAVGLGQVAHLAGEPGVGKSRVLSEFASTLPSTTNRLHARANSYEGATPFGLVADLVRRTFGIASADDEPAADAALNAGIGTFEPSVREAARALLLEILGYGQRSALGPEQKRRLLVSLVRALIEARSDPSVVVTLEDVHWIDPASSDLFTAIVTDVPSIRCLFLTTSRQDVAPWAAEQLALQPLGTSNAAEMVDRVAGDALDPATRALVLERTGGNPFFIEEVVRSIRGGGTTVPATVQDMLEARLDRLDEGPRLVAQRAAVIGRTFSLPLLQRVVPRPDLEAALLDLVGERLITAGDAAPEPTFTFAHALVQEVAYRTQLIAQRRKVHVGVGDAITALYGGRLDEFVDVLAYQYGRGDDDPKARTSLMRAGRRAQRLYAKQEAVAYFGQALERSREDAAISADAHEAIGDVERVTGGYDAALTRYADATAVRGDSDAVAMPRLARKSAMVRQLRGEQAHAAEIYRDVLAKLPPDAHEERARTLLNVADVNWRQGQYDDAMARLEDAIAEAAGDETTVAEALKQLGTVSSHRGELDRAREYFERSLAAYERAGDALGQANVHNNIGVLERTRSRHAAAIAAYGNALAIRERIGDQLGRVHSHNNIGQIHYLRGDLGAAVESFDAALAIARSIGYTLGVGAALIGRGASRVEHGEHGPGLLDLVDGVGEIERSGSLPNLVDALCDLSNAYSLGRSPEALATAERAVSVSRSLRLPERVGVALQALGRARVAAGDSAAAISALEESRTVLGPLDEPQELARTLALLGRLYVADPRRRPEGLELLGRARETFTKLGAALDLRRMEQPLEA